ncbi:MAG: hypothetical protein WBF33_23905 [Candidatus Nitrosopolaris sp.]|jgi:hypothetical protein
MGNAKEKWIGPLRGHPGSAPRHGGQSGRRQDGRGPQLRLPFRRTELFGSSANSSENQAVGFTEDISS